MGTDIHGWAQHKIGDTWFNQERVPNNRNYRLFAALAGVRNGKGFAGVLTHEPIIPLAEGRGVPGDFERQRRYGDEADIGDHSFTHFTVGEALTWDGWDQGYSSSGYLTPAEYAKWDGLSEPHSYCGGISAPRLVIVEATPYPAKWDYARVVWKERLRDQCAAFLAWLNYLNVAYGPKCRVVIGFDS